METAILYGVDKETRVGFLNGRYPESMLMDRYNKNKREADAFSVFGYRRYEIEKMMKECPNPVLKTKLQESLNKISSAKRISVAQNSINLQKLESFKKNACGMGLRKVIKTMKRIVKKSKDKEALLTLMLLETEYANLSAKQYGGEKKDIIYERKDILLIQMTDLLEELNWKYGYNEKIGKNACYLVYVYLPNGVQLTWHCNDYYIYKYYPYIDAEWDGQVCMTMEKILTYIGKKYMSN